MDDFNQQDGGIQKDADLNKQNENKEKEEYDIEDDTLAGKVKNIDTFSNVSLH